MSRWLALLLLLLFEHEMIYAEIIVETMENEKSCFLLTKIFYTHNNKRKEQKSN